MNDTSSHLSLDVRGGLPDALTPLRTNYPRDVWTREGQCRPLAAFWLHVHQSLRAEARQLDDMVAAFRDERLVVADFKQSFVSHFNQFLEHLHGHHQVEDQAFFPKLRALNECLSQGLDLLEADHRLIHKALAATTDSARGLLCVLGQGTGLARDAAGAYEATAGRLTLLLDRHLADEEDLVVPVLIHHGELSIG